jgi:dehydrogenase/reductase SDR family protein 12
MFGQFAATTQFYLHGRKHFTRTGWEAASRLYPQPDVLTTLSLRGRCFVVTGANQGVGYEVAKYLASRDGHVFMVCRNAGRAEAARQAIIEETNATEAQVQCLICDCSVESDVRGMWDRFGELAAGGRLDGLVCNAGALFNDRTQTCDRLETTFALHLLFGSFLMTKLALPHLRRSPDPRVVLVSSGGMLNTAWPGWARGTAQSGDYDGNLAYAYQKRAQVLLAERWTTQHPGIKFVSAHPGWTATAAVDAAYGESKSYLEPMRTPWQGAEGIAWLVATRGTEIRSGEFYLDRQPQAKHMAGAFFSEGSFTKNSEAEVDLLVANLESWSSSRLGGSVMFSDLPVLSEGAATVSTAKLAPMAAPIERERYMGRWFVAASIPTFVEKDTQNAIEDYEWDAENGRVNVRFSYTNAKDGSAGEILQRATIVNPASTHWTINPKLGGLFVPLRLGYYVLHCDTESYSYSIVALPDKSNIWIMCRTLPMPHEQYVDALRRADLAGFDLSGLSKVVHDRCDSVAALDLDLSAKGQSVDV